MVSDIGYYCDKYGAIAMGLLGMSAGLAFLFGAMDSVMAVYLATVGAAMSLIQGLHNHSMGYHMEKDDDD